VRIIKNTFLLTSLTAFAVAQSAFAANYIIVNDTPGFWDDAHDFSDGDIWKDQLGVMPTLSVSDTVSVASKPTNFTINLNSAVSLDVFKLGRYGDGASIATLNVTADLSTSGIFLIAAAGGNGELNVNGATVTSGGNTTIGEATNSGVLSIDNGGIFETAGTFVMDTNSTVTVNDGILKMLDAAGSRITMVGTALLNLNGTSQLWLGGDQTGAGSTFNSYITSGWIKADGNIGAEHFSQVFDGTNTIVSAAPIPEPATYALLGGLLALGFVMVRRR
jgi:hypothetical protein